MEVKEPLKENANPDLASAKQNSEFVELSFDNVRESIKNL